jgi:TonB family protein
VPFEPLTPGLNDNPAPSPQTKRTYKPTDPGVTSPRMGRDFRLPDYPAESFALHEEGQTTVQVCVAASGLMHVERLVKSSGSARLDAATVKAMEGGTFQPGTREGVPVDTCGYNLTYAWSMPAGAPPAAPPENR